MTILEIYAMSEAGNKKMLIIGIGNSGRSDDGLGWLLVDAIRKKSLNIDLVYRYQLQIEDAELISDYHTVIFADATKKSTEEGFFFELCQPNQGIGLSSHILEPETVLWLENDLFKKSPVAFVLGIEGEKWELSLEPSQSGLSNLKRAIDFILKNVPLLIKSKYPQMV